MRLVAMAAFALSGCSFITSTTPMDHKHSCMPNRIPAYVDTAVVPLAGLVDVAILTCRGAGCGGGDGGALFVYLSPLIAAPFVASAIYGFVKDRCP
jgi:hypothetical protein